MKILEISGANLASIKGEFRIALNEPPFAKDGLFAIRGVKGAGKSTLIDAICLALYDETPRTHGSRGPRVGLPDQDVKERIAATDPRGLLHRGASQGWAQVIFLGTDGRPWRAKWSVSRARDKSDGRLQVQTMELEDVQAKVKTTGKRTEVLPAIKKMVGLDFDQFRRSVLLAQGEFAAFVLASEDERANLLEAMTGTGIFAKISMAAYRRCSLEEQKLRDLTLEQEALGLLDGVARAEKKEQKELLTLQIGQQEKQLGSHQADLAWYARDTGLEILNSEAIEQSRLIASEHAKAEGRRQELKRVDAAQPLRPLHDDAAKADARRVNLEAQFVLDSKRLPLAEDKLTQHKTKQDTAQKVLLDAEKEAKEAKPSLDAARDLDTRITTSESLLAEAKSVAERKQQDAADAARALAISQKEEQTLRKKAGVVEKALTDTEPLKQLSKAWTQAEPALRVHAETLGSLKQTEVSLKENKKNLVVAQAAIAKHQTGLDKLISDIAAQQQSFKRMKETIAKDPRAALDQSRRNLQEKLDRARIAESVLEKLHTALGQMESARQEGASQSQALAKAGVLEKKTLSELAALEGRLLEAHAALEKAQAALSLEEQRHLLVKGEACPLCGSLEHPWASGSPLAGLLDGQRKQVQTLERQKGALEKVLVNAQSEKGSAERLQTKAAKDAKAFEGVVLKEEKAWTSLRVDRDWPKDARSERSLGDMHERVLVLAENLEGIQKREDAVLLLETKADALERGIREADKQRKDLEKTSAELNKNCQELALREASLSSDLKSEEKALKAGMTALGSLLKNVPGALVRLEREPLALLTELEGSVQKRLEAESAKTEITQSLNELALQLKALETTGIAKRQAAQEAEKVRQGLQESFAALQKSRKAYWNGQSVLAVEKELGLRRKQSQEALEQSRTDCQAADKALGALRSGLTTQQKQVKQAQGEAQTAEKAFKKGLKEFGWTLEEAQRLLVWDAKQIRDERAALQGLESGMTKMKAILKERQEALAKHRQLPSPSLPLAELETSAGTLKDDVDNQKQALGGILEQLRRDDEARKKSADLSEGIQAQGTTTKLWKEMNELIGSADGKRFRMFAQSLTLEALVAFANDHLIGLDPRYQLQRVPGYELELQVVDRDMGDEIRALNSLSGGETFLASLALALGLSSLSASETPIESLFIDEGFGSLDSDSLEVALTTLDDLQSQGRQVGIISHVDGLGSHIPNQILVEKVGGGVSRVLLPSAPVFEREAIHES